MNDNKQGLQRQTIHQFWSKKAHEPSNRWTSKDMLAFEKKLLTDLLKKCRSVLDLGCGHGELSRSLVQKECELYGVDFIADYNASFTAPNHSFVNSAVTEYRASRTFDVVLLFGVVTYLTQEEESKTYRIVKEALSPDGIALIKNQCAIENEFHVNGYSDALKSDYSARYPTISAQRTRLEAVFPAVELFYYPQQLNAWNNSCHVAFFAANNAGQLEDVVDQAMRSVSE